MVDSVLISGATGFIGRQLLEALKKQGMPLRAVGRRPAQGIPTIVGDLVDVDTLTRACGDIDTICHCAGFAHASRSDSAKLAEQHRFINFEATKRFGRIAADAGVRRFIFLSSIKVNGESTVPGKAFHAEDVPAPIDPYAIAKAEAEAFLLSLAEETGMEVVIIRPPLVYGPRVKANFFEMMRWLYKGVPLPLGAIHNKRSLVALDNLVDLILTCIHHPAAANQIFLVSDGEDLSTTELLRRTAIALGKPPRLIPVPAWLLATAATMLGKRAFSQRLCGSLQVDITKTRSRLSWTPPVSIDEALQRTARDFLEYHIR